MGTDKISENAKREGWEVASTMSLTKAGPGPLRVEACFTNCSIRGACFCSISIDLILLPKNSKRATLCEWGWFWFAYIYVRVIYIDGFTRRVYNVRREYKEQANVFIWAWAWMRARFCRMEAQYKLFKVHTTTFLLHPSREWGTSLTFIDFLVNVQLSIIKSHRRSI